jgi:hypothetical protein
MKISFKFLLGLIGSGSFSLFAMQQQQMQKQEQTQEDQKTKTATDNDVDMSKITDLHLNLAALLKNMEANSTENPATELIKTKKIILCWMCHKPECFLSKIVEIYMEK